MQVFNSYHAAFRSCVQTGTYAIAHLFHLNKNFNIDTTGCYKIFFLLSGGKRFHVDSHTYDVEPGDLLYISPREWHYFSHFEGEDLHERYVLFIFPDYLKEISSKQTNLADCFPGAEDVGRGMLKLSAKEQERLRFYLHKLENTEEYGRDLLEYALFLQLMVFLNSLPMQRGAEEGAMLSVPVAGSKIGEEILSYLNSHITEDISIQALAEHFFLSQSYLCKVFKNATGTTVHKYVNAKRITLAKDLLSEGRPTLEVALACGFRQYNAFLKAFTNEVGMSPKKYARFSIES